MVLEEKVEGHSLVGGTRDVALLNLVAIFVNGVVADDVLHGFHQGNGEPRLQSAHKLAADSQVDTRGETFGVVIAAIDNLHVIHVVGDQAVEVLVVSLCRELERTPPHLEMVLGTGHHLRGTLRADIRIQAAVRVAHLAVEGRLIVEARAQTEPPVVPPVRLVEERQSRGDRELAEVVSPIVDAQTARYGEKSHAIVIEEVPGILYISGEPPGVQDIIGLQVVVLAKIQDTGGIAGNNDFTRHRRDVGQRVAGRVDHRPLLNMVADIFVLRLYSPFQQVVGWQFVCSLQVGGRHHGLQVVAGVLQVAAIAELVSHFHFAVAAQTDFVQPVLRQNVVRFALFGVVG